MKTINKILIVVMLFSMVAITSCSSSNSSASRPNGNDCYDKTGRIWVERVGQWIWCG